MSATHSDARLRGLSKHLTYDHFRTLLSAKNSSVVGKLGCFCYYDIVAELPLEIVQKIFHYLPLHQCFKAQRVSRRWRKVLAAPQTIECLIQPWYPKGETDLCIPNNLSHEATLNLKAEHIDAFQTGHPFSMSILDRMPDHVGEIVYAHGILAWINLDPSEHVGRYIEILDLKPNLRRYLMSEDRTSFRTIAISSSIIAALDLMGRCHVWDINHPDIKYLLQLPSARFNRIVASGPGLAITFSQYGSKKMEIFTWSSRSMIAHSFSLPLQPHCECNISLSPNEESLFLFQITRSVRCDSPGAHRDVYALYFTHMSFDGQIRGQEQFEWLSSMYSVTTTNRTDRLVVAKTVEGNSTATLWLFPHSFPRPAPQHHSYDMRIVRIYFDFERTSFEVEERVFAGSAGYKYGAVNTFIWKDIMYWGGLADECTRIIDFKESTYEKTKLVTNLSLYRKESDIGAPSEVNLNQNGKEICLGDETFLVHMDRSGCWKVWCFDKNIQMPNEDLGYRSLRLKYPQKRILPEVS